MKLLFISFIIYILIVKCEFWQVPKHLQSLAWFRMAKTQKPSVEQLTQIANQSRHSLVTSFEHVNSSESTTQGTTFKSSTTQDELVLTNNSGNNLSNDPEERQLQIHVSTTIKNFTENSTIDVRTDNTVNQKPEKNEQKIEPTKGLKPLNKEDTLTLPDSSTLVKPTKYHYYPHNQHIYLLPECAVQQVCNAIYLRLKTIQPLCACPSRYRNPCSASYNSDDLHTTELVTNFNSEAKTLVKTCEAVSEIRTCKVPEDWSILALQNIRTGKSHYLVLCRCLEKNTLEGPFRQEQTAYAKMPGIRVYGMKCVQQNYSTNEKIRSKYLKSNSSFDNFALHWSRLNKI